MEERIIQLIRKNGPHTGSELLEAIRGTPLPLWKACCLSSALEFRVVGPRYLRLDRRVEGYARLSPSILREFMTYTVIGLAEAAEELNCRAEAITRHIRAVSRAKLTLAERIVNALQAKDAEHRAPERGICFIIAGDVVHGMAHDVPRPEQSIGEMVNGSDIDLVVVADDGVPRKIIQDLDDAIYKQKYYHLKTPSVREEIDYVVKTMERVREQVHFDTFKKMVACKILQEGLLISGSQFLFDQIKGMLTEQGVSRKLDEMEVRAGQFRQASKKHLLMADPSRVTKDDLNLFYSTEELEEFE